MPFDIADRHKLLNINIKFRCMEELIANPSSVSLDVFLTKMIDLGISAGTKILLAILVFIRGTLDCPALEQITGEGVG